MLGLQYEPRYGIIDYGAWPYSKYASIDIPDYKINRPLDYYDKWPEWYPIYLPIPEFRRYLNNLLLRDLRLRQYNFVHTYY
ncbi:hypothetical protein NQ317_004065 [Molorchus minor]|uniref:Uncharacterized protein n=1 Tax=Molorchus minor TaxID=1323400 RepID=A0ABQ9JNN0_9CUCU|nr:hypothetical protein NQ317_004065 [Molorchus minor]